MTLIYILWSISFNSIKPALHGQKANRVLSDSEPPSKSRVLAWETAQTTKVIFPKLSCFDLGALGHLGDNLETESSRRPKATLLDTARLVGWIFLNSSRLFMFLLLLRVFAITIFSLWELITPLNSRTIYLLDASTWKSFLEVSQNYVKKLCTRAHLRQPSLPDHCCPGPLFHFCFPF